ncbi:hypothetical protein LSH36_246g00009 [Paralvinella palmiformis]|uniref:P2X purinoreceptor 7 intracellular domain-containing protein n=1 Tax=Paralvinella palmiformis TaxID=53620 RepID=A0AAD9N5M0_9ANNE|nr:hypothetical protein LSH36_246g00009 [Paralvinella palmiformis]
MTNKRKYLDFQSDPGYCNCANICSGEERGMSINSEKLGLEHTSSDNGTTGENTLVTEELAVKLKPKKPVTKKKTFFTKATFTESVIFSEAIKRPIWRGEISVDQQVVRNTGYICNLLEELINHDRDALLDFVQTALRLHPHLQDLLFVEGAPTEPPSSSNMEDIPWCRCGCCRQMPRPEEKLCCCCTAARDINDLVL